MMSQDRGRKFQNNEEQMMIKVEMLLKTTNACAKTVMMSAVKLEYLYRENSSFDVINHGEGNYEGKVVRNERPSREKRFRNQLEG